MVKEKVEFLITNFDRVSDRDNASYNIQRRCKGVSYYCNPCFCTKLDFLTAKLGKLNNFLSLDFGLKVIGVVRV